MGEIVYRKKVPGALKERCRKEQLRYEAERGVLCAYAPFYFVAREEGAPAGMLTGYTCYSEVYVEDLVVLAEYRNRGIGRTLMKRLEEHFKGRGFHNINLVTSRFQAPGFYEKCGFTLEFVRENEAQPQLSKYFFMKRFDGGEGRTEERKDGSGV